MRLTKEDFGTLRARLVAVREQTRAYFAEANLLTCFPFEESYDDDEKHSGTVSYLLSAHVPGSI